MKRLRKRELIWLLPVWLAVACFVLPFYLLMFLVGLPFLIGSCWGAYRQYRRRMAVAGRVLSWDEAVERVRTGAGTILVDVVGTGAFGHMWWSPVEPSLIDPDGELPSAGAHPAEFTNDQWDAMGRFVRERLPTVSGDVWLMRVPASLKLRTGRLRQELGAIGAIAIEGLPLR